MDHISTNRRQAGRKEYWLTDDANVVVQTEIVLSEIYLDKLQAQLQALEEELASSQPIDLPEPLLEQLNQAMTGALNDGGQMFQRISGIVKANEGSSEYIQARINELKVLLEQVSA